MQKAVIYARVSSKEQEQSGFSIPHQIRFLTEYAQRKDLEVVQTFSESMSAKDIGRIEFDALFRFLKKHKDVTHIIVEKNDRLLRNDFDSAKVIEIATTTNLNFHLAKDNMVLNKFSTPQEILFFTINSAMSCYMPRNLSNEVKKGMDEKAELGFFPGRAPIGYKNFRESKKHSKIVVNEDKAPFIRRAFKLYSSGLYSYDTLAKKLREEGFRPYSNPCNKSNIEDILNNPFYKGEFEFKGKRCTNAQHEPLVSKELFRIVQELIAGAGSPRVITHDFLYRGLLKCSVCGCQMTAEIKKGKYIYYHCTGRRGGVCKKKYLKEKYIDELVLDTLSRLYLSQEDMKILLDLIKTKYKEYVEYEEKAIEQVEQHIKLLKTRLNKLYLDKLDGIINEDFYFEKKEAWQIELDKLEMNRTNISQGESEFIKKAESMLELSRNAHNWYLKQNNEEKRNLLKLVCSNFSYDGSNLDIELKSTFEPILKSAIFVNGGR